MSNPSIPVRRDPAAIRLPRVTTGVGRAGLRLASCYLRLVGGAALLVGAATLLTEAPFGGWLLGLVYLALAPTSTALFPQLWVEHNPEVGVALLLAVAALNAGLIASAALTADLVARRHGR